jgi:hypothetical protein
MNLSELLTSTNLDKEEVDLLFKMLEESLSDGKDYLEKLDKTFKLIDVLNNTFTSGEDFEIRGDVEKVKDVKKDMDKEVLLLASLIKKLTPIKAIYE